MTPSGSRWTGRVELAPDRLDTPMRWQRPRMIFVNSQSDTFHEKVSDEEIAAIFGVMAACPQHTFQVLTKRAARMREWFAWAGAEIKSSGRFSIPAMIEHAAVRAKASRVDRGPAADRLFRAANDRAGVQEWPLKHVMLGVSVEDQERAGERIEHLLRTPAVVRFLSVEPQLEDIDLTPWLGSAASVPASRFSKLELDDALPGTQSGASRGQTPGIHQVICGGESGPGARPFHVEWARSLRDQCRGAGVKYFLKQLGSRPLDEMVPMRGITGKGTDMDEWPEDLRIQEYPEAMK
jgi:protein gp37